VVTPEVSERHLLVHELQLHQVHFANGVLLLFKRVAALQFVQQDLFEFVSLVCLHTFHLHKDVVVQVESIFEFVILSNQIPLFQLLVYSNVEHVEHVTLVGLGLDLFPQEIKLELSRLFCQERLQNRLEHLTEVYQTIVEVVFDSDLFVVDRNDVQLVGHFDQVDQPLAWQIQAVEQVEPAPHLGFDFLEGVCTCDELGNQTDQVDTDVRIIDQHGECIILIFE